MEFNNIYVTGDKHGDFSSILQFCKELKTTKKDLLIVLGDAGINYYVRNNPAFVETGVKYMDSKKIRHLKTQLSELPITMFCVRGNHEARANTITSYCEKEWCGGSVYYEDTYPNLIFPKDGETFTINGESYLVIGGAYSIDKERRIMMNKAGFKSYLWFDDEQLSEDEKKKILEKVEDNDFRVDYILSHTCPYKSMKEMKEALITGKDKSIEDNRMEKFLDIIMKRLQGKYKKWYFGHFHINKKLKNELVVLYDGIECIHSEKSEA